MKIRSLLATGIVALGLSAPANAAMYEFTSVVNGTTSGFGSTVFHSQNISRMNGNTLLYAVAGAMSGTWDTVTGALEFVFGLDGGGTATGTGNLTLGTGTFGSTNQYTPVGGDITISISGSSSFAGTNGFSFSAGPQMGDGSGNFPANGTDFSFLSLWGDTGNYGNCELETCIGADLRFEMTEIPPVPLPASFLLLLGGLGGLGAVSRMRRKSS